jgi:hypothetical protein
MPVDAGVHDRGTYFSNYSSIHSIDAYVGRQQVMYTPGSSPPVNRRAKGSSRFRTKQNTVSQSIMMPANMPNSSQILPERGSLRDVHVHYNIPADEKQIVASLRQLQAQLDNALVQISDLTKERDDARQELKRLRETTKKRTSFAKRLDEEEHSHIEEELFDLSRVSESPKLSPQRAQKGVNTKSTQKTTTDNNARLISHIPSKRVASHSPNHDRHMSQDANDKRSSKRAMVQDTEESLNADITAASNISRRRRPSLDDNMTSAYIIPDITLALKHQQQQHNQEQQNRKSSQRQAGALSLQAQAILHKHDPQHIAGCDVCQRLTSNAKSKSTTTRANSEPPKSASAKTGEYTAHLNVMMRDMALEELTARPKIPPTHALAHMKKLLQDQYDQAKEKHGIAWERYDAIDAPLQSKKHSAIAEDMRIHAAKMEECRINLDQLRDVEEGMKRGV